MRVFLIVMMVAAMSAVSTLAKAQDGDASTRAALAERVIDAIVRENIDKVVEDMIDQMLAQQTGASDEQAAWTRANMPEIMGRHIDGLIDNMEDLYAERFTDAELRALVGFYETPQGRIIARKQNEVGALQGQQMEDVLEAFSTDFVAKYCAEFACPSENPDAAGLSKH